MPKAECESASADIVADVSVEPVADEKRMRLRFAGTCRVCGSALPAKTDAVYERITKTVRCVNCLPAAGEVGDAPSVTPEPAVVVTGQAEVVDVDAVDAGIPGASARREFERRRAKREDRIRTKHPKLGGLILALSEDPQSTRAWDTGALGEEQLGNRLNDLATETLRVLHDRRIPGSKANIDHIAVASSGVYVIDAKKYKGRPSLKVEGGLLRPRVEKLLVGGRDCTKLVDGVPKQVEVVHGIVGEDVLVHGVLCFVEADWPLIGGSFTTRGVEALWPKKLYPKLMADGPLTTDVLAALHRGLATSLPQA